MYIAWKNAVFDGFFYIIPIWSILLNYLLWLDIMLSNRSLNSEEIILKAKAHANTLGKARRHLASLNGS
jgi:hypothetical protein